MGEGVGRLERGVGWGGKWNAAANKHVISSVFTPGSRVSEGKMPGALVWGGGGVAGGRGEVALPEDW